LGGKGASRWREEGGEGRWTLVGRWKAGRTRWKSGRRRWKTGAGRLKGSGCGEAAVEGDIGPWREVVGGRRR